MELGARLKQARLEAGLSQRQLCGDTITRNMLSLIENGSASPSMDTLRVLASRLNKPLSWFLEEDAVLSPNQLCMEKARNASPAETLEILQDYQPGDSVFDREKYLLEALSAMALAEQVTAEGKLPYAAALLEQAKQSGSRTPYFTEDLERRRLLLACKADPRHLPQLVQALPDNTDELLFRAEAALDQGEPHRCEALLGAAQSRPLRYHLLMGKSCMAQKHYDQALPHLQEAEAYAPEQVYEALEICYRELGDYKHAYEYACKRR